MFKNKITSLIPV